MSMQCCAACCARCVSTAGLMCWRLTLDNAPFLRIASPQQHTTRSTLCPVAVPNLRSRTLCLSSTAYCLNSAC